MKAILAVTKSAQQRFKAWSILDEEFYETDVGAIVISPYADASKPSWVVDPDGTKPIATFKKQVLQGRAAGPGDHAVQRALRDASPYKSEPLELREEANPLPGGGAIVGDVELGTQQMCCTCGFLIA